MIIAFSGTHGTGKTTAVYEMAARLKKATTKSVGVILETARECPFPILSEGGQPTEAGQHWIFARQIQKELEMASMYDIVISDRTLVDVAAYSFLLDYDVIAEHQMYFVSLCWSYSHVILMTGDYHKADGKRHRCADTRKRVAEYIEGGYQELGWTVSYDIDYVFEKIMEEI